MLFCWDKHHDQKQTGEERVYVILKLTVFEGNQGKDSTQELKQNCGECAYWFVPGLKFSYPSCMAQAHLPKDGTACDGLGFPTLIMNQKMPQASLQGSVKGVILGLPLSLPKGIKQIPKIRHGRGEGTKISFVFPGTGASAPLLKPQWPPGVKHVLLDTANKRVKGTNELCLGRARMFVALSCVLVLL